MLTRDEAFDVLDRLAQGIAQMFGSTCETLINDMKDPKHPVMAIYNGHVSGREIGSTLDVLGTARVLDEQALTTDLVNMAATTPDGRQIKSSTFHLAGDDYDLALGINFDYSSLITANQVLVDLMSVEADLRSALWQEGDTRRLSQLFDQCVAAVGKPVSVMSKRERMKVMSLLNQKGMFSYRKSVPYVAQQLGVSRYTVYKYLGELAQGVSEEEDFE